MNVSSFSLKKIIKYVLMMIKNWFWLIKNSDLFLYVEKKNGFWRENSNLSLLIKHNVFWFVKKIHICFLRDNKNGFLCNRKIRSISIFEKDIFLWKGSNSQNNFMLHDSNKTTTHDLFLYFKILQVLKIRFVSKEDTKSVLYF